ncbi:MAG: hypothetical protein KKG75_03430 [Nanoarchaeota archaeon]|nr:hypothetical protein [Nanoarchaeota archaeon]
MNKDLIYTYWGRTRIGFNIIFSWKSFGRVRFFEDKIKIGAFPFRKMIPYSKIKKLIWSTAGYIQFEHTAGGVPYVAFWILGKNNPELTKICKILKSKGVIWDETKNI